VPECVWGGEGGIEGRLLRAWASSMLYGGSWAGRPSRTARHRQESAGTFARSACFSGVGVRACVSGARARASSIFFGRSWARRHSKPARQFIGRRVQGDLAPVPCIRWDLHAVAAWTAMPPSILLPLLLPVLSLLQQQQGLVLCHP
jgi:hypothetical protein